MKVRSRFLRSMPFAIAIVAMLLVYARIAMPFSLSPGPIALNFVENAPGLLAIEDELGAEVLESFQRSDLGAIRHGSEKCREHSTFNFQR